MLVSHHCMQNRPHDNDFPEGVKRVFSFFWKESSKCYTYIAGLRKRNKSFCAHGRHNGIRNSKVTDPPRQVKIEQNSKNNPESDKPSACLLPSKGGTEQGLSG